MFTKIVVGADDSPTAVAAVQSAMGLAQLWGAELHIVTASRANAKAQLGDLPAELRHAVQTNPADVLLGRLAEMARTADVEPVLHAAAGAPAEALATIAETEGADLIVVGNKGMKRQGVRRVLGSVPNDVAHAAPCSVLIVDTTD
jgi:nucleotide-binding universal stress UspA family protein